jgi:hypothetical protein
MKRSNRSARATFSRFQDIFAALMIETTLDKGDLALKRPLLKPQITVGRSRFQVVDCSQPDRPADCLACFQIGL